MKISTMLSDVTAALVRGPITEKYPFERREAPERLRGMLQWDWQNCTGCGLCAKDCPAEAIDMIVLDKQSRQFVMRYNIDRCTYCAQCVASCRQNCLSMSATHWELAGLQKDQFLIYYGQEDHVKKVLENLTLEDTGTAAPG
jgi:formate hydrogenlyase subunit 6/NADH:ubiquinone oxidoreductase subunit I